MAQTLAPHWQMTERACVLGETSGEGATATERKLQQTERGWHFYISASGRSGYCLRWWRPEKLELRLFL